MKDRTHPALRRLAAWMVSLWLLLAQLALPAYALTQAEISAMPTVTVTYQTAADAQPTAMPATPTSDPYGKAYWVTLPAEAFGFPITLSVAASPEAPNYVFDPTEGVITTGADTVDFTGASTVISAYQDGVLMEQYHLYVSASQMPAEVPPATVQVTYVDANNPATVLYTTTVQAFYNTDNVIAVDVSQVPEGYTLQGDSTATVTVDENGTANPSSVTFYFQAQAPKQATVYVYYVDAGGNELGNTQTLQLDPGTHDVTPDMGIVPDGYVLSSASPVQVTVGDDGTAMPEAVTFEFAQEQAPTMEPPATEPPATEPPATESPVPTDSTTTEPAVTEPTVTEPPAETPAPQLIPVGRYALTNTVANFRTETSTESRKAFANVNSGAYVWVYGTLDVTEADGTVRTWASISYNGTDCYVWNSLIDTLSQADSDAYNYSQPSPVPGTETSAPPQTAEPTAETTATEAPTATPTATPSQTPLPAQVTGYFVTTTDATLAAGAGSDTMLTVVPAETVVYVEGQNYLDNMAWHKITYQGMSGYLRGDTVRQLNEAELQAYYASLYTPTPTVVVTATPTATATATATVSVSPSPIASASPTATPTATPTQAANMYVGYGVTLVQTALRQNANLDDNSVLTMLPADTLLYLNGQSTVNNVVWSGAQTRLGTAYIGLVQDNAVRRITEAEAKTIIDAYNNAHATATPTASPSPSPVPAQLTGYYMTLGDVPMRTVNSNYGNVGLWLAKDTVVSVSGQVYNEGYGWHITSYGSFSGYVRTDQLRKLSDAEVEAYKKSIATPSPTPAATVKPYDPNAASSYGYVSAGSVNFRTTPSSSSSKIKTLRQYAFALVLGSKTVDGKVWYNLNQAGTVGWVDGSYFKVLSLTELSSFINSKEYLTGLTNNSTTGTSTGTSSGSSSGSTSGGNTGSATQGNVSSVEDWNLGVWQNPNSGLNASYAPFNPYATPTAPLVSATPSPEPTSTFVVGTMIPIPYEEESKETQTGSSWLGLAIGGIVLLGGAGGVYAYALNQNKKRRLAARNAANSRRNAQQGGAAGAGAAAAGAAATTSPYTRRAVAAPPMTGATRKQDGSEPGVPGSATGSYPRPNPYTKPAPGATPYAAGTPNPNAGSAPSPYARPAQEQSPFARPATGTAETEESSIVRPAERAEDAWPMETRAGAAPVPPRSANPYAQPVQPKPADVTARTSPANPYAADTSAMADDESANPTPRRTSRASRYQNHDDTPDA